MAASIIAELQKPFDVFGHVVSVGVSLGIATGPYDGVTAEDLIQNADEALYAAKHAGRGVFRCSGHDLPATKNCRRRLRDTGRIPPQPVTPPQPDYGMPCEAARSPKLVELPDFLGNQRKFDPAGSGFDCTKTLLSTSHETQQLKVSVMSQSHQQHSLAG